MDIKSNENSLESLSRFRKWEKGAQYVFGLDIPGVQAPQNGAFTDLVPEDTVQDYKCRRDVDLNRDDLKRMRLFPALSKEREEFLNSYVNTDPDERTNSIENEPTNSDVKLPTVYS